jgi:hypothetical protein
MSSTLNLVRPPLYRTMYMQNATGLLSLWLTRAPQLLQPGHRGVRPLVLCVGGTAIAYEIPF